MAKAITSAKTEMTTKPIGWFKPYKLNPRDNTDAINSVAESIKSFGFLVPIVADSKGEIAAGHTRHLAAKKLKLKECPVIIADHLTAEQLQAFRLIDNKVSELAVWDMDLLAGEIAALQEAGIELTPYGWTQEEIDCLSDMVTDDCLSPIDVEDGVNGAIKDGRIGGATVSEHSSSVRVAVGTFNFFIPKTVFEEWSDKQRKAHDYDNDKVVMMIAEKLGLVEGHKQHQKNAKARRNAASTASAKVREEQSKEPTVTKAVNGRRRMRNNSKNSK